MCDILNERTRINKILNDAIADGFGDWSMKTDDLVQHCVAALQVHYEGFCVEECLRKRAAEFVALYFTRPGGGHNKPASRAGRPRDADASRERMSNISRM